MVLFKVSFSRFRHSARVNWSVKVYDLKRTHHSLFLVHVIVHRNTLFELLGQFSLGKFDLKGCKKEKKLSKMYALYNLYNYLRSAEP